MYSAGKRIIGPRGVYIAPRVSIFDVLVHRDEILGSPRVENRGSTPGSDRLRSTVYTGITIVHHRDRSNNYV